jgi:hypothetical protein
LNFTIISEISNIEVIAQGSGVRIRHLLNRKYGRGRWRKMKGEALIQWDDGRVEYVELHWFEAHGIGRRLMKRKRTLER